MYQLGDSVTCQNNNLTPWIQLGKKSWAQMVLRGNVSNVCKKELDTESTKEIGMIICLMLPKQDPTGS